MSSGRTWKMTNDAWTEQPVKHVLVLCRQVKQSTTVKSRYCTEVLAAQNVCRLLDTAAEHVSDLPSLTLVYFCDIQTNLLMQSSHLQSDKVVFDIWYSDLQQSPRLRLPQLSSFHSIAQGFSD